MELTELEALVGRRHEENKAELRRINESVRRVELQLAENRGSARRGNRIYHGALALITSVIIPLLVVALEHFWK